MELNPIILKKHSLLLKMSSRLIKLNAQQLLLQQALIMLHDCHETPDICAICCFVYARRDV